MFFYNNIIDCYHEMLIKNACTIQKSNKFICANVNFLDF